MNTADITIHLEKNDFNHMIQRYHFSEEDYSSLQALSRAIEPLLQTKAYYVWKQKNDIIHYEEYAIVFLTLGKGIDELQEVYMNNKCLSEAYKVECIGLELLTKAYEEFAKKVQKETGKWAVKIDFLGNTYPMELLPKLREEFDEMNISYNEQLVLSPGKSVVFLLPMSEKKTKNFCHICENCSNTECLFARRQSEESERTRGANTRPLGRTC